MNVLMIDNPGSRLMSRNPAATATRGGRPLPLCRMCWLVPEVSGRFVEAELPDSGARCLPSAVRMVTHQSGVPVLQLFRGVLSVPAAALEKDHETGAPPFSHVTFLHISFSRKASFFCCSSIGRFADGGGQEEEVDGLDLCLQFVFQKSA